MKKEFKLMINIIKAAPQLKTRIINTLLFLIGGTLLEIGASIHISYGVIGAVYLSITTTDIFKAIMSVSCSGLGQTSSSSKKLQVRFAFYIQLFMNIIFFFVISLHRVYIANKPALDMSIKEDISLHCFNIILFCVICFFLFIYETISPKFVRLSVFCMLLPFITIMILITLTIKHSHSIFDISNLTFPIAIVTGLLLIISGSLLSIILASLLYKFPISERFMIVNNLPKRKA